MVDLEMGTKTTSVHLGESKQTASRLPLQPVPTVDRRTSSPKVANNKLQYHQLPSHCSGAVEPPSRAPSSLLCVDSVGEWGMGERKGNLSLSLPLARSFPPSLLSLNLFLCCQQQACLYSTSSIKSQGRGREGGAADAPIWKISQGPNKNTANGNSGHAK